MGPINSTQDPLLDAGCSWKIISAVSNRSLHIYDHGNHIILHETFPGNKIRPILSCDHATM